MRLLHFKVTRKCHKNVRHGFQKVGDQYPDEYHEFKVGTITMYFLSTGLPVMNTNSKLMRWSKHYYEI